MKKAGAVAILSCQFRIILSMNYIPVVDEILDVQLVLPY